jgi:hypothetical protein
MSKENESSSGMMTALILGGGALAVYWYLNNYGPNGAVSASNPSYWQSWFGTVAAPAVTAAPIANTLGPVTQTQTPTPAAFTFQITGPVTQDINNSLKAAVSISGQSMTVNVIPANAGNPTGVIYNSAGADITSQFTSAQQAQIVLAFQQSAITGTPAASTSSNVAMQLAACIAANPANPAAAAATCNLSGIIQVPWKQSGANLSGIGMSFNSGKGFSRAFSSRRKSTGPYVN